MNVLLKLWQKIAPKNLLLFVRFLLQPPHYKLKRKRVLDYYKERDLKKEPASVQEAIRFLKFHKFSPLPYKWTLKYENYVPEVFFDESCGLFYAIYLGKKLYFPKSYSKNKVIWGIRSILKEQDIQSPHLYLTGQFQVDNNSIVVDAGVAEGNFALSVVERAKRLYLIECDPAWIEALMYTFAPWKEKVIFVSKFLTGNDSENSVKIDSLVPIDPLENYFIKMDIEGFERESLMGMKNLVRECRNIKMNICTYHHLEDLQAIETIIHDYGFKWEVSDGYLLYFQDNEAPSFRKALIRAQKN